MFPNKENKSIEFITILRDKQNPSPNPEPQIKLKLKDFVAKYKCAKTDSIKLNSGKMIDTIEISESEENEIKESLHYSGTTTKIPLKTITYHYFKIWPPVNGVGSNLKLINRELTILGDSSDKDHVIPYKIHDGKIASVTFQGKQFFRLRTKNDFADNVEYHENSIDDYFFPQSE